MVVRVRAFFCFVFRFQIHVILSLAKLATGFDLALSEIIRPKFQRIIPPSHRGLIKRTLSAVAHHCQLFLHLSQLTHFFLYSTILSSILGVTSFSSFEMWGATVLVEWFSPSQYCKRHNCHPAPCYLNSDKLFLTLCDWYHNPKQWFEPPEQHSTLKPPWPDLTHISKGNTNNDLVPSVN